MRNTARSTTPDADGGAQTPSTGRESGSSSPSSGDAGKSGRERRREGWYRDRDGVWLKPCRIKEAR